MIDNQKKWCVTPKPNPSAKIRLFCFPYAGGGPATFSGWERSLPKNIELVAIQPPGRGSHLLDSCIDDMTQMVTQLIRMISPLLDKPYVFFGHSLGSKIAFELLRHLKAHNYPLPKHFIASGSKGPKEQSEKRAIYALSDNQFIAELERLNGTPKEILQNRELMEILLPMLKADFKIAHTYQCNRDEKFNCDVTVFGGTQDKDVSNEDLAAWCELFSQNSEIHRFEGGHFFVDSLQEEVLDKVTHILKEVFSKIEAKESNNAH